MAYNVQAAREAGYSDAEIARHLAEQKGFDYEGARAVGYSDGEIIAHLTRSIPAPAGGSLRAQERAAGIPDAPAQPAPRGAMGELGAAAVRGAREAASAVKQGALGLLPMAGTIRAIDAVTGGAASRALGETGEAAIGAVLPEYLTSAGQQEMVAPTRTDKAGRMLNTAGEVAGGIVAGGAPGALRGVAGKGLRELGVAAARGARGVATPAIGAAVGEQAGESVGEALGGDVGREIGGKVGLIAGGLAPTGLHALQGPTGRAAAVAESGYVVPSRAGGGGSLTRRLAQKTAGPADTDRILSAANQRVTNRLIAQDLGLLDDAGRITPKGQRLGFDGETITTDLIKGVRDEAGQSYDVLRRARDYLNEPVNYQLSDKWADRVANVADDLAEGAGGFAPLGAPARHFLKAARTEAAKPRTGDQLVGSIKKLRSDAARNTRSADSATRELGAAQRRVADILEDAAHEQLSGKPFDVELVRGGDRMIPGMQKARTDIAKTRQAEAALRDGDVRAADVEGYATGGMRKVQEAAEKFPRVTRTPAEAGAPSGSFGVFGLAGAPLEAARAVARQIVKWSATPPAKFNIAREMPAMLAAAAQLDAALAAANNPATKRWIQSQIDKLDDLIGRGGPTHTMPDGTVMPGEEHP